MAFIPNPENKPEVNHINGDKEKNSSDNLEWVTGSENVRHGFLTGLIKRAKSKEHYKSIKVKQYDLQGRYIKTWDCMTDIQRELGIQQPNVHKVCNNKRKTAGKYIWRYA